MNWTLHIHNPQYLEKAKIFSEFKWVHHTTQENVCTHLNPVAKLNVEKKVRCLVHTGARESR